MNIESQNRILPARALQTRDLRDELVLWFLTSRRTRVLLMRVLILIVALPCLSCLSLVSILPRNMLLRLARRRRIRSIGSRIIAPI